MRIPGKIRTPALYTTMTNTLSNKSLKRRIKKRKRKKRKMKKMKASIFFKKCMPA